MLERFDVFIWDFDNVLFLNRDHNYFESNLDCKFVPNKYLLEKNNLKFIPDRLNILLTGRGLFQERKIKKILRERNYYFDRYIFFYSDKMKYPAHNESVRIEDYFKEYWDFKKSYFLKFKRKYKNCNIVVIDDDERVIDLAKQVGLYGINFDLREVDVNEIL